MRREGKKLLIAPLAVYLEQGAISFGRFERGGGRKDRTAYAGGRLAGRRHPICGQLHVPEPPSGTSTYKQKRVSARFDIHTIHQLCKCSRLAVVEPDQRASGSFNAGKADVSSGSHVSFVLCSPSFLASWPEPTDRSTWTAMA